MEYSTKINPMPNPNWKKDDWDAVNFCINNDIIISPMKSGELYKVGIALYDYRNIKYDMGPYDSMEVWAKVLEYSKYYYFKYRVLQTGPLTGHE